MYSLRKGNFKQKQFSKCDAFRGEKKLDLIIDKICPKNLNKYVLVWTGMP